MAVQGYRHEGEMRVSIFPHWLNIFTKPLSTIKVINFFPVTCWGVVGLYCWLCQFSLPPHQILWNWAVFSLVFFWFDWPWLNCILYSIFLVAFLFFLVLFALVSSELISCYCSSSDWLPLLCCVSFSMWFYSAHSFIWGEFDSLVVWCASCVWDLSCVLTSFLDVFVCFANYQWSHVFFPRYVTSLSWPLGCWCPRCTMW